MERTRGEWQGYVASGADKEERNKRLMEVQHARGQQQEMRMQIG